MRKNNKIGSDKGPYFGMRHVQSFLIFLATAVSFAMRVNLSVGIVAMTDKKNANPNFEEFDWNERIKSLLLGSFFWGYVITQVPSGYLAQRFGARHLLFVGLLVCSLSNLLTPWCTSFGGWKLLFAIRILQGLCQGAIYPSSHALLSKWAPPEERGVLATFAYSGTPFGTVSMLAISGVLASELGWPSIFYFSGILGLLWCVAWFFFGFSSPAQCKMITVEERLLIETSLGKSEDYEEKHLPTPWCKVFKSLPFWSIALVHCTHIWGYYTMLTQIPSYMKGVLGMDIKSNALLSALPYATMGILSLLFVVIAKVLSKKDWLSIVASRKLFNTIGHWTPMVTLIALGYVTKDEVMLAVILLMIGIGFNSAVHLGFQVNHIDLAPNFAGTLMGATNCIGNVMGVLAPLTVGFIVKNEHDPNQWRIVFFITSAIYFIGNLMFLIFGKADIQDWNAPKNQSKKGQYHIVGDRQTENGNV